MLFFIFMGVCIGFALGLRLVRRPPRAFAWGLVLGAVLLLVLLGPASAPVQGIGSALYFAFFALGPLMLLPFLASGVALGVAGAAAVLWIGSGRAVWVTWVSGVALLVLAAGLTVWPTVQNELYKRQLAQARDSRAAAAIRADIAGDLGGHSIRFPASPRLSVTDGCAPGITAGPFGCFTNLIHPVTILTQPGEILLHERSDPIQFRNISVTTVRAGCRAGRDFCLTQEKVDHWCREVRPDQSGSLWCRDMPAMPFSLRLKTYPGPLNRAEPELSARLSDTPLGPGQVTCFYSPDPTETDRQGNSCQIFFDLTESVAAIVHVSRDRIASDHPDLRATIAAIPSYWAALTDTP